MSDQPQINEQIPMGATASPTEALKQWLMNTVKEVTSTHSEGREGNELLAHLRAKVISKIEAMMVEVCNRSTDTASTLQNEVKRLCDDRSVLPDGVEPDVPNQKLASIKADFDTKVDEIVTQLKERVELILSSGAPEIALPPPDGELTDDVLLGWLEAYDKQMHVVEISHKTAELRRLLRRRKAGGDKVGDQTVLHEKIKNILREVLEHETNEKALTDMDAKTEAAQTVMTQDSLDSPDPKVLVAMSEVVSRRSVLETAVASLRLRIERLQASRKSKDDEKMEIMIETLEGKLRKYEQQLATIDKIKARYGARLDVSAYSTVHSLEVQAAAKGKKVGADDLDRAIKERSLVQERELKELVGMAQDMAAVFECLANGDMPELTKIKMEVNAETTLQEMYATQKQSYEAQANLQRAALMMQEADTWQLKIAQATRSLKALDNTNDFQSIKEVLNQLEPEIKYELDVSLSLQDVFLILGALTDKYRVMAAQARLESEKAMAEQDKAQRQMDLKRAELNKMRVESEKQTQDIEARLIQVENDQKSFADWFAHRLAEPTTERKAYQKFGVDYNKAEIELLRAQLSIMSTLAEESGRMCKFIDDSKHGWLPALSAKSPASRRISNEALLAENERRLAVAYDDQAKQIATLQQNVEEWRRIRKTHAAKYADLLKKRDQLLDQFKTAEVNYQQSGQAQKVTKTIDTAPKYIAGTNNTRFAAGSGSGGHGGSGQSSDSFAVSSLKSGFRDLGRAFGIGGK